MVPDDDDPRWTQVLTSEQDITLKSLPSKLLISKLRMMVREDPSAESLRRAVTLARDYFTRNERAAAEDLAALLGHRR